MGAVPNNGVIARDLRLTIRRVNVPNTRGEGAASLAVGVVAALLLHDDVELQKAVSVLEVHDLRQQRVVAQRSFGHSNEAHDVRHRFATHVESMDPDEYSTSDWQHELDAFN